jgi:thiopeptide-type bacteriocin biosynthesis protein
METWKSYRIYYQNYAMYDGLILLLADLMERWMAEGNISKWFFLRYWEDGPHIRIRYLGPEGQDAEELFEKARSWIRQHPAGSRLTKQEYFRNHKFDGVPLPLEQLGWYEEGEIVAKPYEPEYERYGGVRLMPLTETLFLESSRMAVRLLRLTQQSSFTARFLVAMTAVEELANLFFAGNVRLGGVVSYYRKSADSWKRLYQLERMPIPDRFVQARKDYLRLKEAASRLIRSDEEYGRLRERLIAGCSAIADAIEDDQKVRSIFYSHLHMLNNRLGMGPEYEYALYEVLWRFHTGQEANVNATVS